MSAPRCSLTVRKDLDLRALHIRPAVRSNERCRSGDGRGAILNRRKSGNRRSREKEAARHSKAEHAERKLRGKRRCPCNYWMKWNVRMHARIIFALETAGLGRVLRHRHVVIHPDDSKHGDEN